MIDESDFALTSPLRICFPNDTNIMDARLLGCVNIANQVAISIEENVRNEVMIGFEYLGKKEEFVVSILHNSDMNDPEVSGVIKDGAIPKRYQNNEGIHLAISVFRALIVLAIVPFVFYSISSNWKYIVYAITAIAYVVTFVIDLKTDRKTSTQLDKHFEGNFKPQDFTG